MIVTLEGLKVDREDLQNMLAHEQQKLIDAQNTCLKIEGAIEYNRQVIEHAEAPEPEPVPEKPVTKATTSKNK